MRTCSQSLPKLFCLLSIFVVAIAKATEPPGGIRLSAQVIPVRVVPGSTVEFALTVELPPGWIIYDIEQPPNSVLPARIELDPVDAIGPAESFHSEGAKEGSEPKFNNGVARYFDRSPTFRRPLVIAQDARTGDRVIQGRASFLAKNLNTGLFYLVSDAPFAVRLAVLSPDDLNFAPVPPVKTLHRETVPPAAAVQPTPKGQRTAPKIHISLNRGVTEPERSVRRMEILHPLLIGLFLVASGVAAAACIPPPPPPRIHVDRDDIRAAA